MLKESILNAVRNRISGEDNFDIHKHLESFLQQFGLTSTASGGAVTFTGKDPVVPSTIRFAAASAIGLTAKAVAVAKLWKIRTGENQDITTDLRKVIHRLSPFFQGKWEKINGFSPGFPTELSSPFAPHFYETRDGRHVMPLDFYNRLRISTLRFLNVPEDREAIAAAIKTWHSDELEAGANAAGLVMTKVRTVEEFLETEQFRVMENIPMVTIEKIGESAPVPFSENASSPLDGIRALGMGHVIAGAGTGRALALHGADVLNIWTLTDTEMESLYATADVGMRSAKIDLTSDTGRSEMQELIRTTDVFFANRRVGFLEKHHLSAKEMAAVNPGIIHATVSLFGEEGPWAHYSGFDVSAGAATGVMTLEGSLSAPALPSIMVVDDYLVSWIISTAIISALIRRASEGGSYRIHVCLARTILWMYQLGIFDKTYADRIAGSSPEHTLMDPDVFTAETPMGFYQGVSEQVVMTAPPGHYKYVLVPRGAGRARWDS